MKNNMTFTMIKPDAMENGYAGDILSIFLKSGFRVSAMKLVHLTISQAQTFYGIHSDKSFFEELVVFMTRSPIIVAVLEKNDAVEDFRKLIGSTDPEKAEEGTIRKLYATSIEANAIHGSDSDDNAKIESDFFFKS